DRPGVERGGQLEPTSADVGQRRLPHLDPTVGADRHARLATGPTVDLDHAGQDQRLSAGARLGQTPVDQSDVEASARSALRARARGTGLGARGRVSHPDLGAGAVVRAHPTPPCPLPRAPCPVRVSPRRRTRLDTRAICAAAWAGAAWSAPPT